MLLSVGALDDLRVGGLGLLEVRLEGEGDEEHALALVELGLELDPVETERVEEGGEALHHHEDGDRAGRPEAEDGEEDGRAGVRLAEGGQRDAHDHVPEHLG